MSAFDALRLAASRRPFVLLAFLLLVPALGFGLLGWRSVLRERDLAWREAAAEASDIVASRRDRALGALHAIESRERERPYFHYQPQYAPEATVFQELDFQVTPLTEGRGEGQVRAWFQWELGSKGVPRRPDVFGRSPGASLDMLTGTYGPFLRPRLEEAARGADALLGRRVDHPLRIVQANEERGQLIEEIQIVRQALTQGGGEGASGTPYLRSFFDRVGDDPVPVRYGEFRYVVADLTLPLVAWRVVWIPAVYADRREVGRDRWLLQGYVLNAGRILPPSEERLGAVRVGRGDRMALSVSDPRDSDTPLPPDAPRVASLPGALDADRLWPDGRSDERLEGPRRLLLVAVADADTIQGAFSDSSTRFLLLLAGVLAVVAVGFFVVTRGLRREIGLARRKEDFVAAVTHELKTPLAGIRMYADMLKEGWVADADAADRYAGRIIEESERLGHLVDQVLDLAALERGVARANAAPGDLGALTREAVALCEARTRQAGVELRVDVEEKLPPVTFDPRLVKPLLLNLLDNAIKYSEQAEEKSVRVTVTRDGDAVVLGVADRGVGVDPRVRRHLFRPFHRAGNEMTRSTTGIGIGLALVKRYADAHRAKVTLQSEVGEGTTVRVRFPL